MVTCPFRQCLRLPEGDSTETKKLASSFAIGWHRWQVECTTSTWQPKLGLAEEFPKWCINWSTNEHQKAHSANRSCCGIPHLSHKSPGLSGDSWEVVKPSQKKVRAWVLVARIGDQRGPQRKWRPAPKFVEVGRTESSKIQDRHI